MHLWDNQKILVAILIGILFFSGCTNRSESPQLQPAPPAVTFQQPVQVNWSTVCSGMHYTWAEYRTTTAVEESRERREYSKETYTGQPAIHLRRTVTYIRPDAKTMVYDLFYGERNGRFLGGQMKQIREGIPNGEELTATDFRFADSDPYCLVNRNTTVTFLGTEKVVVPAGTFKTASHFATWLNGIRFEIWTDPTVPAYLRAGYEGLKIELLEWG